MRNYVNLGKELFPVEQLPEGAIPKFTPSGCLVVRDECESSSVVERQLPKLNVVGSIPISRSMKGEANETVLFTR